MMITLTYLEFYSGIGGWGYALEHGCRSIQAAAAIAATASPPNYPAQVPHKAKKPKIFLPDAEDDDDGDDAGIPPLELRAQLLAAYDHSDLCNSVFSHNHIDYSSAPRASSEKSASAKEKKKNRKRYKPRQTPIERLALSELESLSAMVWCMSPPCQPHTRQHSNQRSERDDPRSKSFLHLCQLLSSMEEQTLPALILLENVVGFEQSDWVVEGGDVDDGDTGNEEQQQPLKASNNHMGSFQMWRRTLSKRNYHVGHFHLDPTHVGIPNTRPRHYTVAFHRTRGETLLTRLKKDGLVPSNPTALQFPFRGVEYDNLFCRESLEKPPIIHNEKSLQGVKGTRTPVLPCVSSFLDADLSPHAPTPDPSREKSLKIPEKIRTSSSSWCFDIATPHHRRSSCFTHSYGKFIRGTGSILYTGPLSLGGDVADLDGKPAAGSHLAGDGNEPGDGNSKIADKDGTKTSNPSFDRFRLALPEERTFDPSWSDDLDWDHHIRYFSGTEIARLMGFPVAEQPSAIACDDTRPAKGLDEQQQQPSFREFSFPSECTMKQQWKLMGNSLNVRVAACVAEIGIQSLLNELGDHHDTNK